MNDPRGVAGGRGNVRPPGGIGRQSTAPRLTHRVTFLGRSGGQGDGAQAELAPPEADGGGLPPGGAPLGDAPPTLGGGERRPEIGGAQARREADVPLRAVVLEPAGRQEGAVAGHGPRVVVAAL